MKKDFNFIKQLAKNNLGKQLGKTEIQNTPVVYNKSVSKIKNKRLNKNAPI